MKKNKTFLIIQLTRFGDLVQTYQATKPLRDEHPEITLKLVARKEFARPLDFLLRTLFDEIIYFSPEDLVADTADQFIKNMTTWVEKEELNNSDVLINLSFCKTSQHLATILESKNKLGTRKDEHNQTIVKDQWSQLIHSMVQGGTYCPFNLVDIYKNILGLKPQEKPLFLKKKKRAEVHLAIHPFASDPKKRWRPSKWTEVIFKFLKENPKSKVTLFGAKNERNDALQIIRSPILQHFKDQIQNSVGELHLEQTYHALGECTHFIGHDSLLGHLAKEQGLPTLTLALGTVRPIETAPYGEKSFILSPRSKCFPCFTDEKCQLYQCHGDLSYRATVEILNQFVRKTSINPKQLSKNIGHFHLSSIDIYELKKGHSGHFFLDKIGDDSPLFREYIKDIFRVAIAFKFEDREEKLSFPNLQKSDLNKIKHLQEGIQQYYELCEFGKHYSFSILTELSKKNPDVKKIKDLGEKISEIDDLQELLKKPYNSLSAIIDFYKVAKFNLFGNNLIEMSESSFLIYKDNMNLCSILYELLDQTAQHLQRKFNIKREEKAPNPCPV